MMETRWGDEGKTVVAKNVGRKLEDVVLDGDDLAGMKDRGAGRQRKAHRVKAICPDGVFGDIERSAFGGDDAVQHIAVRVDVSAILVGRYFNCLEALAVDAGIMWQQAQSAIAALADCAVWAMDDVVDCSVF